MELYEKADQTVVQKTKNKEVVDIDGRLFMRQINPSVIIMPYTIDDNGVPVINVFDIPPGL